jgi:hypothetical protein
VSKENAGFERPNFTATPNTLIDHLLPVMSNAELRVTLILIRMTTGWHLKKTADALSIPALAQLAGLSDSSCKTGLGEGVRRGTLKKYAVRDELNRKTYRYSVQFKAESGSYYHEIERPKKETVNPDQDKAQANSSSQNLTGLDSDRVEDSSSQNLTGWPEDSSGQILTGSYKEERNTLSERKTTSAADAADSGETPETLNPSQPETGTAEGEGERSGDTVPETISPAAALEAACGVIAQAFEGLRAKNKDAAVKKLASEALRLEFSVDELRSAVSWASLDSWWATKLVPGNFSEMLTRWDKEHNLRRASQPRGGSADAPPAPEFTFVSGERRKAPDGKVLTVEYAEDGQVFWVEAVAEAPARLVHGWPLVEAVGA